jgi:hypothetical protein
MESVHVLPLAAAMDLDLCQLDIDTAFMYAPILEDFYIRQPLGLSNLTSEVCHLKRCVIDHRSILNLYQKLE